MSLDLEYATRLTAAAAPHSLKWIEEALPPDDYWGYADLRRSIPKGILVATGEHEAALGFPITSRHGMLRHLAAGPGLVWGIDRAH